jgi:hypothetical protein
MIIINMKLTIYLIALTSLLASSRAMFNLSQDFVTGFESGIFIRDESRIFEDYSCQEMHVDSNSESLNKMIATFKFMAAMLKIDEAKQLVDAIEVFLKSISQMVGIFGDYDGGEFCSGLIFGNSGA